MQQRLEAATRSTYRLARLRSLQRLEKTGRGDVNDREPPGDDIVGCETVLTESQHAQMLHRLLALVHGHRERMATVGDYLVGIELHAPGAQQLAQVGGPVGIHRGHRVLRIRPGVVRFGERVDKGEDVPAAQRELIDGELGGWRWLFGVHQHQHIHARVDVCSGRLERMQLEELLRVAVDHPRLARLPGLRIEARAHRQRGHPGHHGLLGVGELVNELDDVVFEELFLVGIEELDGAAPVSRVSPGKPEIELRAAAKGGGAYAEFCGAVLFLRERLRIDDMQVELAVGAPGKLLE